MKLRISFFNLTPFKKNLTRFAPIWALYLIGMVLVLFDVGYGTYDRFASNYMPELIMAFGIVNLIYAGICGMMLFGDLYNTRMCYSLHTVPMRREGLFLSSFASALVFSLAPNALVAFMLMFRLKSYAFLALFWLLATTLQFIFFFGIATLAAMLTGNRFAMGLVYLGINFVSLLALWIVTVVFLPEMPGVILDNDPFFLLCPVVQLFRNFTFFEFESKPIGGTVTDPYGSSIYEEWFYEYTGLGTGWGYLAAIAGVGILATVIALVLYKLRHLESAGDFVAFPKLKGAACVVMTLCVSGVFAFLGEEMMGGGMLLWLIVGLLVGFFGSLMLLERRLKVFRKRTCAGFAVLALMLAISYATVYFDVFQVVHWVPKAENVESITISNTYLSGSDLFEDDIYWEQHNLTATITDPAQIEQAIAAHDEIVRWLDRPWNSETHRVTFRYTLKNGRNVIRTYRAPATGDNYRIIRSFLYTPQSILGYTDWDSYVRDMTSIWIDGSQLPYGLFPDFLEALRLDCEAGTVNSSYDGKEGLYVDLQFRQNGLNYNRTVFLTQNAQNTRALLKKPEVLLGYTDWEAFLAEDKMIFIKGFDIPVEYQAELLEAIRADCASGGIEYGYSEWTLFEVEIMRAGSNQYRLLHITKNAAQTLQWLEEHEELLNFEPKVQFPE